jgi:hypothetical protein
MTVRNLSSVLASVALVAVAFLATSGEASAQTSMTRTTPSSGLGGGLSGTGGLSTGGLGGTGGGSSLGGTGGNIIGGLGGSLGNLTGGTGGTFSGGTGGTFVGGTGGSFTGGTYAGGRTGTGSASIGSTTFLGSYYANPMSLGLPGANNQPSGKSSFGKQLYNTTSSGTATISRSITTTTQQPVYTSTVGTPRAPSYVTGLGFRVAPPPPERLQGELRDMIARSTRLSTKEKVRVEMDGETVVLQGSVADEAERRLVEGMVRLTPGVREVRNELVPREKPPIGE